MFTKIKPFLVGVCMWMADVVPGVSWWTIAFISWIYDELVKSIARVDVQFLKHIVQLRWKSARQHINATFLCKVFWWVIIAILTVAHLIEHLMEAFPLEILSFFFGLILASIFVIYQHGEELHQKRYILRILIGIILWYLVTTVQVGWSWSWVLSFLLSWALASIAMILPWISWSYILLIIGKYESVLSLVTSQTEHIQNIISSWDLSNILSPELILLVVFIVGVILWLLLFSRVLQWLLAHYKQDTIALLLGIMLWTLPLLRPWSEPLAWHQRLTTIWLCLGGVGMVLGIHLLAQRKEELDVSDTK